MIQIAVFALLTLSGIIALAGACVLAVYRCFARRIGKANPAQRRRLLGTALFFAAAVVLNAGLVALSQLTASTPPIVDENRRTPENSIAELKELVLNGRRQWISLRGWDRDKPVLLFLAGGPGGTQLAAARHELAELEKHFVVVGWDQPGAGKSYTRWRFAP